MYEPCLYDCNLPLSEDIEMDFDVSAAVNALLHKESFKDDSFLDSMHTYLECHRSLSDAAAPPVWDIACQRHMCNWIVEKQNHSKLAEKVMKAYMELNPQVKIAGNMREQAHQVFSWIVFRYLNPAKSEIAYSLLEFWDEWRPYWRKYPDFVLLDAMFDYLLCRLSPDCLLAVIKRLDMKLPDILCSGLKVSFCYCYGFRKRLLKGICYATNYVMNRELLARRIGLHLDFMSVKRFRVYYDTAGFQRGLLQEHWTLPADLKEKHVKKVRRCFQKQKAPPTGCFFFIFYFSNGVAFADPSLLFDASWGHG